MPELKWIKLYTKMFDDEKIQVIEQSADGEVVINIWVKLLCLAGKTNAGGYIFLSENIPYNEATLAAVLHKPALTVRQALAKLQELGMIQIDTNGIFLTHWETYQILDSIEHRKELQRERTAKFREKQRMLQNNDNSLNLHKPFLKCNANSLQVTLLPEQTSVDNNLSNGKALQVTQCNAIDKEEDIDNRYRSNNNTKNTIQKDSGKNNGKIPDWIDNKVWDDFLEMRKKMKCSPTERAKELLIINLEKFKNNGDNPNDILNQSIMNNWRGVFPLKNQNTGLSTGDTRKKFGKTNGMQSEQEIEAGLKKLGVIQ